MDGSFSNNPFEGEETKKRIKDIGTFLAEATPIVGDAIAAEEIYEEVKKPNPNWYMVGVLGGAAILGLFPVIGDAAAKLVKAGAKKKLDVPTGLMDDPQGFFSDDIQDLGLDEFDRQMNTAQSKRINDYLEKGRFQPPALKKEKRPMSLEDADSKSIVDVSAPYDATTEAILTQYGKGNLTSQQTQKLMKQRGLQVDLRGNRGIRDDVYPSISRLKEGEFASGTQYDFAKGGDVAMNTGISQEVADILREKHGFSFGDTGAFVSPTGAQVPIMLNEGGLVPGYKPGGYVDPVFAAVKANNEKARAEQEALEAYKASLATAGPTPLEIAQAGYAANQAPAPAAAPFAPLPPAAAAADPNRPGMMLGESGPFIAPGAPAAPAAPPPVQVMDVAPPPFSTGAPLSPMVGTTQTPAPVQAAIPANTGPVGYTVPINVAEPIAITPAPAPAQTTEQLEAALDAARDLSFSATNNSGYKGSRTSPVTGITYKGDKKAYEYELGPEYDNVVAVKRGNSVKLYKDGERVGFDAIGLKGVSGEGGSDKIVSLKNQLKNSQKEDVYEQFGGKDSELVSQYLKDQATAAKAQAKKDDKKDDAFFGKIDTDINSATFGQRTGGRMGALNKQVKTEAERLFPGDPNAVDKYYDLGNVERIKMAGRDIAEVFDPSLGPLFQNPDAMDPDNARSLGILAPTGAITSDRGPLPRPDDLFPTPVDGAGPTMIPDLVTPEGGRFGDLFPSLINAANAGTIENPQGLEFTQNQTTPYSELGVSPGAMGGALLGMSPGAMGGALPGEQVLAGTDDTPTMDAIMAGVNLDKEGSSPKDFIDRLALSESSGNYQSVNSLGYSGLLQFGQPRLDDYNNAFGTDITTKEFAADNDLQDKVNLWHIKDIDKTYDKLDPTALAAAGVDKDGFRAAAHIGGKTGATKFVNSLGAYNPSDANQTSIADYVQKFKKPEPVQTAGLNFSLSDLNPANFFRSAGAATVPSATVPSATVPYEDVDPELANQMQQYSAARQGLIYDPSLNQTYTPESFEEMQRAAAGIDDQGLLSATRAVLGESITRGTDNALENVGVLATLTGFDGAADTLNNAIDTSTFRGRSASAKFADPQIEGPIGFGEGEVDPSIAAAYADSRSGMLDYSWEDLPGAVLEQVPNVVVSSLAAMGTYLAAPAIGLTGTAVTIATGTAAAMPEILQVLGPVALERAQANNREVPNAGDWAAATATAVATGALNAIPFLTGGKPVVSNITGRIVNKFGDMFKEGTTEGLQAFVQQFGATAATEEGLDLDAKQAMAEAVIAGPGGLAVAGGPYRVNTGGPSSAIDAAPSTTVIPGAGPDIATDLNIQSPEAGVVNITPSNVANLSKISTPSGISTLAIPGQPGALPTNIDTTQPYTQTPNYLYGVGPTIKPFGISPGGVANVTAPAGDTAVNFPSSFSTLETPAVDQEAMDVIAKVDDGGRPFAMTNNLLRILRNNNITADANTNPAEAIAALKVKASSAPSGVASLSTLGDPSNVTPPKPFRQAQQAIIQEIVETGGLSVKTANRLSNDLNMSMPEITRIAENAMGLDMSTPALSGPAPRTDMLPSGVSTLADTKGIGNLIVNPPSVGKVPVRDKDTGKLTPAVINPVKTSIAADPTLLSMPTDTNINITTDPVTAINPVATTAVDTGPVTETAVDPGTTVPTIATVDIPPEVDEVEIEVDEPTAEDPINIVEEETDDDKPPFECPDGFTAVKVDGQFVCMPDEEEEDDGADTVIQKVRPRISSYYRPNTNAVLDNYTPYRPYGR